LEDRNQVEWKVNDEEPLAGQVMMVGWNNQAFLQLISIAMT
jgi:hypothetical protein